MLDGRSFDFSVMSQRGILATYITIIDGDSFAEKTSFAGFNLIMRTVVRNLNCILL